MMNNEDYRQALNSVDVNESKIADPRQGLLKLNPELESPYAQAPIQLQHQSVFSDIAQGTNDFVQAYYDKLKAAQDRHDKITKITATGMATLAKNGLIGDIDPETGMWKIRPMTAEELSLQGGANVKKTEEQTKAIPAGLDQKKRDSIAKNGGYLDDDNNWVTVSGTPGEAAIRNKNAQTDYYGRIPVEPRQPDSIADKWAWWQMTHPTPDQSDPQLKAARGDLAVALPAKFTSNQNGDLVLNPEARMNVLTSTAWSEAEREWREEQDKEVAAKNLETTASIMTEMSNLKDEQLPSVKDTDGKTELDADTKRQSYRDAATIYSIYAARLRKVATTTPDARQYFSQGASGSSKATDEQNPLLR